MIELVYVKILVAMGQSEFSTKKFFENLMMNIALRTSRIIALKHLGYDYIENLLQLFATEFLLILFSGDFAQQRILIDILNERKTFLIYSVFNAMIVLVRKQN